MSELKLCINCDHCTIINGNPYCYAPENITVSLVTGKVNPKQSCEYLRSSARFCGREGYWFKIRKL
jgi:hypothetical protein